MRRPWQLAVLSCLLASCASHPPTGTGDGESTTTIIAPSVEPALQRAGANRPQIEAAIEQIPAEQGAALRWMIAHMPEEDLRTLDSAFLVNNCTRAFAAWRSAPWRADVPEEIFLDAILPYASVNERRDDWREDLHDLFWPLVAHARSSSQAAAILNREIFKALNVKYSTKRGKPDQSPYESMQSGLASCTGLSILLIDACRSVGVPARFVGTALWSDKSGNHSWVEIWDNGWHFTGAAEPSGDDLDRAWFTDRAASARRDDPLMGIYAVTWRDSSLSFPMVWRPDDRSVRGLDVTDRYTTKATVVPEGKARVRFRVQGPGGRVAVKLTVTDQAGAVVFEGTSKDERFDSNDHLTAILPLGGSLNATVTGGSPHPFKVEKDQQIVELPPPGAA